MNITDLLTITLRLAAPTILVAQGGLFSMRIDIFNLGLEGFMLMGCFTSIVGAYLTANAYLGILAAALLGTLVMLVYAFFIFELHVDPVVCAIAIITIASGLTRFLLVSWFKSSGRLYLPEGAALSTIQIPFLNHLPFVGPILNNHSILVYFALLVPFLVYFILYKTNFGLSLRAVGMNQEAAVSASIPVKRIQYLSMAIGGMLCGLGGAQLAMASNLFNVGMNNGRGYTAIAALILTGSEPIRTFWACLVFGFAEALVLMLSGEGYPVQILSMLPYVLALMVAILPPVVGKMMLRIRTAKTTGKLLQSTVIETENK